MTSLVNPTKHLQKKKHKIFPKIEEGMLSNSFQKACIAPIPKPDKHITRKGNCRPISLMNIDIQILNNMPAN